MSATPLNHRYQILSRLAGGGFGETYLAIDTQMPSKRRCVIKKLQPAIRSEEMPAWLQERFEREAAVLEELGEEHPQIPRLYGYFADGGDFFLVQEWIEGVTLTEKHEREGDLSEAEVSEILVHLLPVLEFIHRRRIIHRDVKPDNIILRKSDNLPVLIDFGVIKEAVATRVDLAGKSAYSIVLGTPGYMAPEQAAGRPVYSSDLYSLGLTAIFLLVGKTPQYLETDVRTGEILWRKEVARRHSHLATVLERAIRFHPRDRYAGAGEMLAALRAGSAGATAGPTLAVVPDRTGPAPGVGNNKTGTEPVPGPGNRGKNWGLSLLALGGVAVGAFAAGYLGFLALLPKGGRVQPTPRPEPSFRPEPSPVEIAPPATRPTPPPSPVARPRRTPPPLPEVTPAPEITPGGPPETALPLATPTPEAIPIPVPPPETDPAVPTEPAPSPGDSPADKGTPSPGVEPSPESVP